MNHNKAYIIKGSEIDQTGRKEWIEIITRSKSKAERFKINLNKSLLKEIEKGREVFDLYIKNDGDQNNTSWDEMEFHTEKMNDKEFTSFCSYRYGKSLPFRIEEIELS